MQVGIAEFLEKVAKLKTKEERVAALKENDSLPLRIILQGAFDYNVVWLLPEGEPPPYKPNELIDQEHILIGECENLRYFVKGFHDLPQKKREAMFIEFLERIDKNDAILLCDVVNHKLPKWNKHGVISKITKNIVKEAFPDMFPNDVKKEEEEEETNNVEI